MSRIECLVGRHRHPVSVVGMSETEPKRGQRVFAGFRCRCGALVFREQTEWRASKRGLKREIVRAKK